MILIKNIFYFLYICYTCSSTCVIFGIYSLHPWLISLVLWALSFPFFIFLGFLSVFLQTYRLFKDELCRYLSRFLSACFIGLSLSRQSIFCFWLRVRSSPAGLSLRPYFSLRKKKKKIFLSVLIFLKMKSLFFSIPFWLRVRSSSCWP